MRSLIIVLVWTCFLTTTNQVVAEDKTANISTEDAAAVQKGVRELGQMFEVDVPEKEQPTPTTEAPEATTPTKTVADVMDKAVDKISGVVGTMAKAIENIAPDVWRIMLKQQYAKAIGGVIPSLGFVIVVWTLSRSFKKWRQRLIDGANTSKDADQYMRNINDEYVWACGFYYGSLIITAFSSLNLVYALRDSIQMLINPEFYAIQDLLRMMLNKGM